jgi:hypothetical protein
MCSSDPDVDGGVLTEKDVNKIDEWLFCNDGSRK